MNDKWTSFLNGILKMPGAKIDRSAFLRKTFKDLPEENIVACINDSPLSVLDSASIDAKAKSIIKGHTYKAMAISTATGIPGGFAILATIPADLANYYYHIVSIGQKLGYLYGFPDMVDKRGNLTDDGEIMLTAFIGVMNNVRMANELIKKLVAELSKRISERAVERIAGNLLSKQIVAQGVEFIAQKLGTQITAKTASRSITKAIPLVSGLICGAITYATFKPQAKRLHQSLKENANGQSLVEARL